MELLIKYLTYTHITAGVVSLIVAPIAMAVAKGGYAHRIWGKVFFWSMAWICLSAIIISVYKWIPFLLLLAILSFYASYSGYRTLYQKQLHLGKGVMWYDWFMVIATGLCMIGFAGYGVYLMVVGKTYFGLLAMLFGFGGMIAVWGELKTYLKPPKNKHHWLFNHIGSMVGGFIASVTAFSTQTLSFLPGIMPWIWPAILGTPFIIFWTRYYRKKLGEGAPISSLVQLTLHHEGEKK